MVCGVLCDRKMTVKIKGKVYGSGKTGTGVRGVRGIGEGTGKEIGWCKEGPGKEVEVVWACDEDCRQQSV